MFDATRKFLSAQFQITIPMYIQLVTTILHLFWCWLFVIHFNWRETGAALATNITYICNMILIDIWCYSNSAVEKTWIKPDRRAFSNICGYLKIGIPGACMLCFEWWCFELLAIFSGLISVEALAAEVVIVNIVTFIFMIPLGTSYSASAFTGIFLGEMKIDQAKKYSRLTIVYNIILTVIVLVILGTFKDQIANLFT